jgi:hypothetical protein
MIETEMLYVKLKLPDGRERWMTREDFSKLYCATMSVFASAQHFRSLPEDAQIIEFADWQKGISA